MSEDRATPSAETPAPISLRDIWAELVRVLGEHRSFLLAATAVITAGNLAERFILPRLYEANLFWSAAVGVVGQLLVVEHLLADRSTPGFVTQRLWAVLASQLVIVFGVVFGVLLLVLPGLYLLGRWMIAVPLIVTEDRGPLEALQQSWRRTSASDVPLAGVNLIWIVVAWSAPKAAWNFPWPQTALGLDVKVVTNNLVAAGATVVDWALAVAVYRLIVPNAPRRLPATPP